MKQFLILIAMVALISVSSKAQQPALIPQPSEITLGNGTVVLSARTALVYDASNAELKSIVALFNQHLQQFYGFQMPENTKTKETVTLKLDQSSSLGKEAYRLKVDKKGVLITASSPAGIFYGTQTLKQLVPVEAVNNTLPVDFCDIKDQPRFSWRGLHLDVGRHFFPVSFIKKYLDYMAMYKLNTFHWHLTEDQGWRLEIKKYPQLTDISSWRDETLVGHAGPSNNTYDGVGYGGFYTQDQVKEIVKYAAERYITVVPEIEMPGHSSAVLAAFPQLGCTGGPYKVQGNWGVFEDVFCAGKEDTFEFLENVLDEVCQLFPSKFIHIGGDECPKTAWEKCPDCQKRIKDEGLNNEHELQSYFIQRIEKYLNTKGREIIGWDEILEGGLAPGATVMSWRGIEGGIAAAQAKHNAIMTPGSHLYFDHYQSKDTKNEPLAIGGYLPLETVYSYEPIPQALSAEEAHYILGAQANVWTEYIPSTKYAEYMVFPRVCALSEVVWSPKDKKDFSDFEKRMDTEYERLDKLNVNYRKTK